MFPGGRARVAAPRPAGAAPTPLGPRLHAAAVSLKTFEDLSHEHVQEPLFGRLLHQSGLTNMLRWARTRFDAERATAPSWVSFRLQVAIHSLHFAATIFCAICRNVRLCSGVESCDLNVT